MPHKPLGASSAARRNLVLESAEGKRRKLAMEQNWRSGLAQDSRNKIINRIMDTLQRHTPLSNSAGITELWKIANRFEEKIFYSACDQHDYLRKISVKMLNLETRGQNPLPTSTSRMNQSSVRPLENVRSSDSSQWLGQPGGVEVFGHNNLKPLQQPGENCNSAD